MVLRQPWSGALVIAGLLLLLLLCIHMVSSWFCVNLRNHKSALERIWLVCVITDNIYV